MSPRSFGCPAFALLKIDDYRMVGQREIASLDVMDAILGGEGIESEPST